MSRDDTIRLLWSWIDRYRPDPRSVLELGCGTGSILAGFTTVPELTGLDLSPQMLDVARGKVPAARLLEADISKFQLGQRFDVVVCVFDTVNHLLSPDKWRDLFDRVSEHLVDDGLFIFDVNTIGKLRSLADAPAWVHDFDGNVLIMNVEFDGGCMSVWDVRVFEQVADGKFALWHERIGELGVPLEEICGALRDKFDLLEQHDPEGGLPTDDSGRVYFVCRRTPGSQIRPDAEPRSD